MNSPTPAEVRAWAPSLMDWAAYGLPAPEPPETADPAFTFAIETAVGDLWSVTGRTLASIVAAEEVAVAKKALVLLVVFDAFGGGDAALSAMEQPWLKSFSAGSYSETRFSPAELGAAGAKPYPAGLWWRLWALMSPEKRDEWTELLERRVRPAGGFFEPDWGDDGFSPFDPTPLA